jgi:mannose-1-phosphate guanylyltransferase
MAGGSGTRFWPRSREGRSKQFLAIFDKKSLLQTTVSRFSSFIDVNRIFIVAKADQVETIIPHVRKVSKEQLIYEPTGKNTAPCIGLAVVHIYHRDKEAIVAVTPSDHLIKKGSLFRKTMEAAFQLAAKKDGLITIGIPPNRPATGYGYIQVDAEIDVINGVHAFGVRTFAEKPNLATAERFLKSGDFYWNSGIFVFKASVFLKTLEEHLPDLYDGLGKISEAIGKPEYDEVLQKVYSQIHAISIDYGVLEKAKNVYVVKGSFEWSDLGSWEQVYKLSPKDGAGNVMVGDALAVDSRNSYVHSSDGVVALLGLDDVIVVQENGATLVCKRDRAEDVKKVVNHLKKNQYHRYL